MTSLRLLLLSVVVVAMVSGCGIFGSVTPDESAPEQGVRIVLRANPGPGDTWPADATSQERIMQSVASFAREQTKQLVKKGLAVVTVIDSDKIAIELPAGANPAAIVGRLTGTRAVGKLEFYYIRNVRSPTNPLGEWSVDAVGDGYVFTDSRNRTINSLKQPAELLKRVVGAPKTKPVFSGGDLKRNATVNTNSRNQIVVQIQFNEAGTKRFAEFTRAHIDEYLAIFYNGRMLTCPVIKDAILDGMGEVSGFRTLEEAKKAADSLNASGLPIPLRVSK